MNHFFSTHTHTNTHTHAHTHIHTYTQDSCKYKMNCEDVVVSELFELLDGAKNNGGIRDWGIKRTTLEDGE